MRCPHVAIDLHIVDADGAERTGLGRYALELTNHLPLARPEWTFTLHSNRLDLLDPARGVTIRQTRWPTHASVGRVSWLQLGSAASAHPRPDVWFSPAVAYPLWWRGPIVATIHDLVPLLMPDRYRGRLNTAHSSWALRRAARQADRILCGSSQTRSLLIERLGADPNRVQVTPYGVAEPFFAARRAGPSKEGRFLLFVGTFESRKGLETLHESLRAANRSGEELRLVLAGNPGWKTERLVEEMRADPQVEFVTDAADDVLADLYGKALALVYPSRMEGFGLPVAEAMAVGCPVIASDHECIREFAGDGPRYVQPGDVGELTAAIEELRREPEEAGERAAAARSQVEGLRWRAVAEATAEAIEEAWRGRRS